MNYYKSLLKYALFISLTLWQAKTLVSQPLQSKKHC